MASSPSTSDTDAQKDHPFSPNGGSPKDHPPRSTSASSHRPTSSAQKAESFQLQYPKVNFHGANELLRADIDWWRRMVWALIIVLCAIGGVLSCWSLVKEFLFDPTATSIKVLRPSRLLLPQVTICPVTADSLERELLWPYLTRHFPDESDAHLADLVTFIVAGSGFQKMGKPLKALTNDTLYHFEQMYRQLRGNRTVLQYFHYFFDTFGFSCKHLFVSCHLGGKELDCCRTFAPSYAIRRGRCFSSGRLYQTKPEEHGQLRLRMNIPPTLLAVDLVNENLVGFIQDVITDVAPFPRYYPGSYKLNRMRVSARRLILIDDERNANKCGYSPYGKGTCYLEHGLRRRLHDKYNCLLPYWPAKDTARWSQYGRACEPRVIIDNYDTTIEADWPVDKNSKPCVFACERWEYRVQFEEPEVDEFEILGGEFGDFKVEMLVAHIDLTYDEITELRTISVWGLIAQIGGQLGLFMGCSIISFVQLAVFLLLMAFERTRIASSPPAEDAQMHGSESMRTLDRLYTRDVHDGSPNVY